MPTEVKFVGEFRPQINSNFVGPDELDTLISSMTFRQLNSSGMPEIRRFMAEEFYPVSCSDVPKGKGVIVNLWAIGRDKSAWPRPEEFIPVRFLAGQEVHSSTVKEAYRPFGAGRRVCPGMEYTARSVPLASILHRNEWKLPDGGDGIGLEGMDLNDRYGTVLNPATPLHACCAGVSTV